MVHEPVELPDLIREPVAPGTLRLMASALERDRTIPDVVAGAEDVQAIQILVGPEGGYTVDESSAAAAAGWTSVTMGPRPLRAETAGLVAVAIVQTALGLRPGRESESDRPAAAGSGPRAQPAN